MAGSRKPGSRPSRRPAAEQRLADAAGRVLAWEGAHRARVELTLLDGAAMRRLNARAFGRPRVTDVIAFALPQPDGSLLGDVYVCPAAAAKFVANGGRDRGRGLNSKTGMREELIRLAVHGTLHVLGYDHPEGPERTRSRMWRRQERYVRRLLGGQGGGRVRR